MVEKPRFQKTGKGFLGKTFKFNVKPDGSSFLQTGIKGSGSFENLKQQWVKVGSQVVQPQPVGDGLQVPVPQHVNKQRPQPLAQAPLAMSAATNKLSAR